MHSASSPSTPTLYASRASSLLSSSFGGADTNPNPSELSSGDTTSTASAVPMSRSCRISSVRCADASLPIELLRFFSRVLRFFRKKPVVGPELPRDDSLSAPGTASESHFTSCSPNPSCNRAGVPGAHAPESSSSSPASASACCLLVASAVSAALTSAIFASSSARRVLLASNWSLALSTSKARRSDSLRTSRARHATGWWRSATVTKRDHREWPPGQRRARGEAHRALISQQGPPRPNPAVRQSPCHLQNPPSRFLHVCTAEGFEGSDFDDLQGGVGNIGRQPPPVSTIAIQTWHNPVADVI